MRNFLIRIVINGLSIWAAAAIVPGVELTETDLGGRILTVLLVGLIFGVVNAVLKPVLQLFTLPLFVLTLGLFTLVVNGILFMLTGWIAGQFGLAFEVESFGWGLIGALVVSLVSLALSMLVDEGARR